LTIHICEKVSSSQCKLEISEKNSVSPHTVNPRPCRFVSKTMIGWFLKEEKEI
jgi:hypothetical protein